MDVLCYRLASSHRRALLGHNDCHDGRWGPLRGRVQLLVQLADGERPLAEGEDDQR